MTSLTKYVGGHSDLIAGGCSGTRAALEPIRGMRTILGTMCDPHTGWLLMRSLETLKLRMTAAAEGARKVAEFLRGHPGVASVWYLGFLPEDHPDRPVFERQCKGAGSTFSFEVKGGEAEAFAVLDRLEVIKLAVSLGGTETLASHPAAMTHSDIPPEEQMRLGDHARADPPLGRDRKSGRSDRRSRPGAERLTISASRRMMPALTPTGAPSTSACGEGRDKGVRPRAWPSGSALRF